MEHVSCNLCGADRTSVVLRQGDPIFGSPKSLPSSGAAGAGCSISIQDRLVEEIGRYYPSNICSCSAENAVCSRADGEAMVANAQAMDPRDFLWISGTARSGLLACPPQNAALA